MAGYPLGRDPAKQILTFWTCKPCILGLQTLHGTLPARTASSCKLYTGIQVIPVILR
jgi:hypothetical protein